MAKPVTFKTFATMRQAMTYAEKCGMPNIEAAGAATLVDDTLMYIPVALLRDDQLWAALRIHERGIMTIKLEALEHLRWLNASVTAELAKTQST